MIQVDYTRYVQFKNATIHIEGGLNPVDVVKEVNNNTISLTNLNESKNPNLNSYFSIPQITMVRVYDGALVTDYDPKDQNVIVDFDTYEHEYTNYTKIGKLGSATIHVLGNAHITSFTKNKLTFIINDTHYKFAKDNFGVIRYHSATEPYPIILNKLRITTLVILGILGLIGLILLFSHFQI